MFKNAGILLLSATILAQFIFSQPVLSQVPYIPYGPEGLMYSCRQYKSSNGCRGELVDSLQESTTFRRAKRSTKNEFRKVQRERSRARRKGHRSIVLRTISDASILRKVQKGIRRCQSYQESSCRYEDYGYNNPLFSDVCEAFGTTAYSAQEDPRYTKNGHLRIVNGAVCNFNDTPIVPIDFRGNQYCTGNVIAEKVILTAAHCVEGISCEQLSVTNGTGIRRAVSGCVMHPKYRNGEENDIAILYLEDSIQTNIIQILTQNDLQRGESAVFAGFGASETYQYRQLRGTQNTLTRVEDDGIDVVYNSQDITKGNTCYGDSGGPLAVWRDSQWVLAGIVSNGDAYNCALPGYERSDISRWANITSPDNLAFIRKYTDGIID